MRIAIVGTGYVGLVSGACLAEIGHVVTCIDRDAAKIAGLRRGVMPIFEPGLAELVRRMTDGGRLDFADGMHVLDPAFEAVLVAVGTPPSAIDGSADLSAVFAVAAEIARHAKGPLAVVTKSTVPVGTGDRIERLLRSARPGVDFDVVSNPEFLREGEALSDFLHPDRVVVGAQDERGHAAMRRLYGPLTERGTPLLAMSRRSAELAKYAANGFLATKISFVNEIADLCEGVGGTIEDVALAMGTDPRIGREFLRCGPGYGGSCFPKDTEALVAAAHSVGVGLRVVEGTIAANEARKRSMARRVATALGGDVSGRRVGVLGLTFKPGTDDMREAPALQIVNSLAAAGAEVSVYDPEGMGHARAHLEGARSASDPYDCVADADAVVLVTDWREFIEIDLPRLAGAMRGDIFVDLRNAIPQERLAEAGLRGFRLGASAPPDPREDGASGKGTRPRLVAVGR